MALSQGSFFSLIAVLGRNTMISMDLNNPTFFGYDTYYNKTLF